MPVSSALQFFQTLNTYSRLYPNKQAEVAQQLENLINGTTVPDTIIKKEKELLGACLPQTLLERVRQTGIYFNKYFSNAL